MPELAEVEYFRKQWDAGLEEKILAVELHAGKRIFRETDTPGLERGLVRHRYLRSKTRGKQMLCEFEGENWLGIHLGMSGKLRTEGPKFEAQKHDHLLLRQAKRSLIFSDPRLFGRVRFHHGKDAPAWWKAGGPEIHTREFTKQAMREFVRRHLRAPLKAVLLLQAGFPGVGNWMADEILWRARIAPRTPAGNLSAARLDLLWRTTRFVARAALKTIGRDYSDPPTDWLLHERWRPGGKCPRDGSILRRATIGGRTTAWCALCQRSR